MLEKDDILLVRDLSKQFTLFLHERKNLCGCENVSFRLKPGSLWVSLGQAGPVSQLSLNASIAPICQQPAMSIIKAWLARNLIWQRPPNGKLLNSASTKSVMSANFSKSYPGFRRVTSWQKN